MGKFIDLSNRKFGRLTAIKLFSRDKEKRRTYWECVCDCGNTVIVEKTHLQYKHTKSCGCLQKEKASINGKKSIVIAQEANITHGMSNKRIYGTYRAMKRRCYDENFKEYKNYGGKGIIVCDEWLHDMQAFIDWSIANGYTDELTIDRKDNSKGYSPDNCRFITQAEQNKNTTRVIKITIGNETKLLAEWLRYFKIPHASVWYRVKKGMSYQEAIINATTRLSAKNS